MRHPCGDLEHRYFNIICIESPVQKLLWMSIIQNIYSGFEHYMVQNFGEVKPWLIGRLDLDFGEENIAEYTNLE